ncbi:hypothetical protein BMETH_455_0 [methanotrophic bacterial endosymbiont of Bathymodiolus sp.]|nr:hypothetical protein BMETH_455_0 [methanotrophic bacterial endosymbiont of Bathymodiolus sp.]
MAAGFSSSAVRRCGPKESVWVRVQALGCLPRHPLHRPYRHPSAVSSIPGSRAFYPSQ